MAHLGTVEREEFEGEGGERPDVWLSEDDLPGGIRSGILIHSLLEVIDLETLRDRPALEAWCAREPVRSVSMRQMARHGVDSRYLPAVLRLVFGALTTPISLPGAGTIEGLAWCGRLRREMEFLYPFPEAAHPRLSELARGKFTIQRGFIKGFVDLLFDHQGRVYFADWKSDVLPDYGAAFLSRHVGHHYLLQAQLYMLAIARLVGIHGDADYTDRFGGLLYLFVRGMDPADPGVGLHFERPTWERVVAWERELSRPWPPRVGALQAGRGVSFR